MKEIKELIKSRKPTQKILKALELQNRIRFHCDQRGNQTGKRMHLERVKKYGVSPQKMRVYENCLVQPYCTHSITNEIFVKASKALQNNDFSIRSAGNNTEKEAPSDYGLRHYYSSAVLNLLQTDPFCYVFCDKPKDGGKPYFYTVRLDDCIDVKEVFSEGLVIVEEILFRLEDQFIYADSEVWNLYNNEGELLSSQNHKLGVCPCFNVWHDFIDVSDPTIKKHICSSILSDLDEYMIMYYGRFSSNMVEFYPTYWIFEKERGVKANSKRSNSSNEASSSSSNPYNIPYAQTEVREMIFIGNVLEVPKPRNKDSADLREPMGRIPSDVPLMDQTMKEVSLKRREILESVLSGNSPSDLSSDEKKGIVTATEVNAVTSSKKDFLKVVKDNIEKSYNLVLNCMSSLEKSSKFEKHYIVDLGNDFFQIEENQAEKEIKEGKNSGLGVSEMMDKYRTYIYSRYSKDKKALRRALIISYIEPLPFLSLTEAKQVLDEENFSNKVNLLNNLTKFEFEKGLSIEEYEPEKSEVSIASEFIDYLNKTE